MLIKVILRKWLKFPLCSTSLLLLLNFQCNYYLILWEQSALWRGILSSPDISESEHERPAGWGSWQLPLNFQQRPGCCPAVASVLDLGFLHFSAGTLNTAAVAYTHTGSKSLGYRNESQGAWYAQEQMFKHNTFQTSVWILCPPEAC